MYFLFANDCLTYVMLKQFGLYAKCNYSEDHEQNNFTSCLLLICSESSYHALAHVRGSSNKF